MNRDDFAAARPRKLSLLLSLGIIFMPVVFSWLLLRRGYSNRTRLVAFAWTAIVFWGMGTGDSGNQLRTPEAHEVATASERSAGVAATAGTMAPTGGGNALTGKPAAPAKAAEPAAPSVAVQRDTRAIAKIEKRIASNADLLKSKYATPEMVDQAANDLLLLALAKETYGESTKSAQEQELGRKAAALLPRAGRQTRELYASALELIFVKQGMDLSVEARGEQRKVLHVSCAIMSKPVVYQLQNELGISEQARNFGFGRIVFTNGFEGSLAETWTVNLDRD